MPLPAVMESQVYWMVLVLPVIYLFASYLRLTVWSPLRKVPGPFLAQVSGLYRLALVATGRAPSKYQQVHQDYGKIVRVGPNHVSVSDASVIPTIYGLGSKFLKTPFYSTLSPFYKGATMDSMFTERNPQAHKSLKTPVAQLFSMTNMRNFEPYADECTAIFDHAMRDLEGQTIDLAIWLQWYAFDVIACITFQRRFGFLEQRKDVDYMIESLDEGLRYIGIVGQFPAWHPWLMGNRLFRFIRDWLNPDRPNPLIAFMEITESEIQRYDSIEKGGVRTDFLAQLRAKEAKDGKISDRDMLNHLANNLLAGSDTTAISLRACFYYVIKTPRVYKRLVAEILEADQKGELSPYITYSECLKLPYLQVVMKEAMRVHPGVGFPLERYVPSEGTTILGKDLPGGTIVSMSAPVVHQDTAIFGLDAAEFRPERWLDSDPEQIKLMDRSLLTFGYGARTCIGKNISIMEMGKFIPQILRHFDIEWSSPKPEWDLFAAWFWKQSEILVKFKRRETIPPL